MLVLLKFLVEWMLKFLGNFVFFIYNYEGKFIKVLCINFILFLDWIRKRRIFEISFEYFRGEFFCLVEGVD